MPEQSLEERLQKQQKQALSRIAGAIYLMVAIIVAGGLGIFVTNSLPEKEPAQAISTSASAAPAEDPDKVVDGIHIATGLVVADGFEVVKRNCTSCHSGLLISQNRMTRDRWLETIRWMQKTQKLWDLGANEETILDYLEKNYAPTQTGRRAPLANIDWYMLD